MTALARQRAPAEDVALRRRSDVFENEHTATGARVSRPGVANRKGAQDAVAEMAPSKQLALDCLSGLLLDHDRQRLSTLRLDPDAMKSSAHPMGLADSRRAHNVHRAVAPARGRLECTAEPLWRQDGVVERNVHEESFAAPNTLLQWASSSSRECRAPVVDRTGGTRETWLLGRRNRRRSVE